jgi:hypothetical protein
MAGALVALVTACGNPPQVVEAAGGAPTTPPSPPDVLTPLAGSVLARPSAVTGADGREHVAYELMLTNPLSLFVTLEKVEIIDPARHSVIASIEGDEITSLLTLFGTEQGPTFRGGQSGVMVLDAIAARPRDVPRALEHRVTVTLETEPGVPFEDPDGVLATTFTTGQVRVSDEAPIVVAPPLRGERWWDGVGCCETRSAHRGAVLAVNGAFHVAERYAIDFVQLDAEGRLYSGPIDQLSSYAFYGANVHAVATGKVVNLLDGQPEQVPGSPAVGVTGATAGGNFIVQDIGGGRYAFYAHLQPGSLRFEVGDTIREGEVLGLLGNTGNSDAPHLHFHVMDGPEPLASNGLPYEFTRFTGRGVVTNIDEVVAGEPADLDAQLTGRFRKVLPLDQQVVDFPT